MRITRAHLLAGLLLGALGFSLVVQARQTQSGNLTSLSQSELVRLLDQVSEQNEKLDADARNLQAVQDQLRNGSDSAAAARTATQQRLEVLGILAGTLQAAGPGITLTIDDPQGQVDSAMLLDTVQELRDAGAEAMQLGAVRVIASTSFTDGQSGQGVSVDGVTLTAPYTFVAIGDPATMDAALDIPGGIEDTLHQEGARGTVQRSEDLKVSAVHQVARPKYAVPNSG
jgi:uncharacterized protein YlxW (UPF0749 family)